MKAEIIKEMKRKMDRALEVLGQDFARIRTGRASVALLEGIKVDAYGTAMPISSGGVAGRAGAQAAYRAALGHSPDGRNRKRHSAIRSGSDAQQ